MAALALRLVLHAFLFLIRGAPPTTRLSLQTPAHIPILSSLPPSLTNTSSPFLPLPSDTHTHTHISTKTTEPTNRRPLFVSFLAPKSKSNSKQVVARALASGDSGEASCNEDDRKTVQETACGRKSHRVLAAVTPCLQVPAVHPSYTFTSFFVEAIADIVFDWNGHGRNISFSPPDYSWTGTLTQPTTQRRQSTTQQPTSNNNTHRRQPYQPDQHSHMTLPFQL